MWKISNIDNNLKLTKEQAQQLADNNNFVDHVLGYIPDEDEIFNELFTASGKKFLLNFNPDHMEHMDFIAFFEKEIKALKAKGDITFGSTEGDNAGDYWGYRFDGKGGMKKLVGQVNFAEVDK